MKITLAALLVAALVLSACEPVRNPGYATEDECEDAGRSDAFCDALFPEMEDFVSAKPKKQPTISKTRSVRSSTRSSSRSSFGSSTRSRRR